MRICCWNVRRASAQSRVWEYFAELSPDLALLQEVSGIPIFIDAEYQSVMRPASGNRFNTAILVRGALGDEIQLTSRWDWVNRELELFRGNLVAHKVSVDGYDYRVMSVYSPAQPVNPERLQGIDVEPVKLKLNPKVWGTELMWAALLDRMGDDVPWVVGGDLNASETFDYMWSGGPRGNQEILERMSNLGLVECLRHAYGKLRTDLPQHVRRARCPPDGPSVCDEFTPFKAGSLPDRRAGACLCSRCSDKRPPTNRRRLRSIRCDCGLTSASSRPPELGG